MPDQRCPAPGQDIRDRTFHFACRVTRFCDALYRQGGVGRLMAHQLLDSGTSAAAMMEEAKAAESRRDFVSKCSIALKEAREAHVRLRVHESCHIGPAAEATALRIEADQVVSILTPIIRNTKLNSQSNANPEF